MLLEKKVEDIQVMNKSEISSGFVEDAPNIFHIDPVVERRVVRKLDTYIMPFICISYLFTYLDKAMLGYAAVFDLKKDLNLRGTEYSWISSIFYFGYLTFEYFSCFGMQKTFVSKWLAANLFLWGGVTMALGGGNSFGTFMGLRVLLGALESCANPAFLLLTSMWYTREEQPIRIGYWSIFLGIANSFGGLLAYGIGHIHGALEQPWRYQFIIIGALTSAWGLLMFFALSDNAQAARWLSASEKKIAVERLRQDQPGHHNKKVKKCQIVESFLDPKTWIFFFLGVSSMIVNAFISNFGALIVKGFGYTTFQTLLLQIPFGVIILLSTVSAGHLQRRLPGQKRCAVGIAYILPALAGSIGMYTLPRTSSAALLFCYYLNGCFSASWTIIMSLVIANVSGSTKKSTVNAIFFISYCTGNIVGPFSFLEREAPKYTSGIVAVMVAFCVEAGLIGVFAVYAAWLNRKKKEQLEALYSSRRVTEEEQIDSAFQDLTDKENPFFRYLY